MGLTICYDLRFPELYRALALRGARLLLVPAAFTEATGRDHWEVLLRARAIENGCFVVAAGQWGAHAGDRLCHGRSMIVDPWGVVLAVARRWRGSLLAELDLARSTGCGGSCRCSATGAAASIAPGMTRRSHVCLSGDDGVAWQSEPGVARRRRP